MISESVDHLSRAADTQNAHILFNSISCIAYEHVSTHITLSVSYNILANIDFKQSHRIRLMYLLEFVFSKTYQLFNRIIYTQNTLHM